MTTPFWYNDPNILLNKDYIFELWPSPSMSYEQKMNAITRIVILFTVTGFLCTLSFRILVIGVITLVVIAGMYKRKFTKEGFESSGKDRRGHRHSKKDEYRKQVDFLGTFPHVAPHHVTPGSSGTIQINPATLEQYLETDYETVNKKNPMNNVLLTQINDEPMRKSAPPSFNTKVYEDINNNTKKMIQSINPGIKNTNKQLFGDLGEKFEFDQSMWHYYSTPNTKIANDQGAFAKYLYGDMPSARDGNAFALVQDNPRYTLY